MRITNATVRFGSKVGLPNFSNIEAHVELGVQIEEDDDQQLTVRAALAMAKAMVKEQLVAKGAQQGELPQ